MLFDALGWPFPAKENKRLSPQPDAHLYPRDTRCHSWRSHMVNPQTGYDVSVTDGFLTTSAGGPAALATPSERITPPSTLGPWIATV